MTKIKETEEKELLQMIIRRIWPPPFLCKWSFAKRAILQMAKIKWMEERGLLQMTIWVIRPPPCSSVSLQMVICKEDDPPDDQYFFGSDGAEIRTRPASYMEDPQYKITAQTDQRVRS